jgi:hypothetical protein
MLQQEALAQVELTKERERAEAEAKAAEEKEQAKAQKQKEQNKKEQASREKDRREKATVQQTKSSHAFEKSLVDRGISAQTSKPGGYLWASQDDLAGSGSHEPLDKNGETVFPHKMSGETIYLQISKEEYSAYKDKYTAWEQKDYVLQKKVNDRVAYYKNIGIEEPWNTIEVQALISKRINNRIHTRPNTPPRALGRWSEGNTKNTLKQTGRSVGERINQACQSHKEDWKNLKSDPLNARNLIKAPVTLINEAVGISLGAVGAVVEEFITPVTDKLSSVARQGLRAVGVKPQVASDVVYVVDGVKDAYLAVNGAASIASKVSSKVSSASTIGCVNNVGNTKNITLVNARTIGKAEQALATPAANSNMTLINRFDTIKVKMPANQTPLTQNQARATGTQGLRVRSDAGITPVKQNTFQQANVGSVCGQHLATAAGITLGGSGFSGISLAKVGPGAKNLAPHGQSSFVQKMSGDVSRVKIPDQSAPSLSVGGNAPKVQIPNRNVNSGVTHGTQTTFDVRSSLKEEIEKLGLGKPISSKIKEKLRTYVRQIEEKSSLPIESKQKEMLANHLRANEHKHIQGEVKENHSKKFDNKKFKDNLKAEWSKQTDKPWPDNHHAHHIIPQELGGPHEWWNFHPMDMPNHIGKGGIHSCILKEIVKEVKKNG